MSDNQEGLNLEQQVKSLRSLVLTVLEKTIDTSHTLDRNFEVLKSQIADIEVKLDKLPIDTGQDLTSVDGKLDDIHSELKKIEKVSRYTEEFENLLKISR